MKSILLMAAGAALALCMGACERISDDLATYEGPRTLSPDAQTVVYVSPEDATPIVDEVYYWLIQDGTEKIEGNEAKSVEGGSDLFEFDFFTITVVGQNIVLDIDGNSTDCYREITVKFQCVGYDPDSLTITQLPAGRELED